MQNFLILDFGNVLAYPITGEWFITPNFMKIIGKQIDTETLKQLFFKYDYLISKEMETEEKEYTVFNEFYRVILEELNIENSEEKSKKIARDFVYNDNKYKMYDDVEKNIERLSQKYKLILLTDNWPCVFKIMEKWKIDKFFEKVYVSSIYKCQKKHGTFFDYPINDYNIKVNEVMFVDDNIELLHIAKEKGLIPILMDRENNIKECKYKIINSLEEI